MVTIKKPTLIVNSEICRNNIRTMAEKARKQNIDFRPHFKTHQSATIGEWYRDEGVKAITVSSVSMAQYFVLHGWDDITIAFPVNILEIDEINQLASKITLQLLIESEVTSTFLSKTITTDCGFFIKIDTGYHRAGISPKHVGMIDNILRSAEESKLHFKGFLTHSGHSYHTYEIEELKRIQQYASENMLRLKKRYQFQYPNLILSVGDTPICSQLPIDAQLDEIRPGNFAFYDVMQFSLGSCRLEDIAVALVCPVVAMHHNRNEAIIYGGGIHLSKEKTIFPPSHESIFGLVVAWNTSTWDTSTLLGKLSSISQEHGIITLTQAGCNLQPGDLVAVLPIHSCLTANCMRTFYTHQGEVIETMNS